MHSINTLSEPSMIIYIILFSISKPTNTLISYLIITFYLIPLYTTILTIPITSYESDSLSMVSIYFLF